MSTYDLTLNTSVDNGQQQELPPIESYPAIEALLEDYKRRAVTNIRRCHLWGAIDLAVFWILWRWPGDLLMRTILIVCFLPVLGFLAKNLAWSRKIAGNVLSDWGEFEKALRSRIVQEQEETVLKNIDDELKTDYVCIQGFYLTKSWLIRLAFDLSDSKHKITCEPIIIMKLSGINRAVLKDFTAKNVGPFVGGGPRKIWLEYNNLTYCFCFLTRSRRKEFLDSLLERRPNVRIVN